MSVDLSVFRALQTTDNALIQRVTELIMEASSDPGFVQFLFAAHTSDEARSDPILQRHIQLQIVNVIREHWTSFGSDTPFWTPQQQQQISAFLLSRLFELDFEFRYDIIAAFRVIIIKSFPASIELMREVAALFSVHGSSIVNLATLIRIVSLWARACHVLTPEETVTEIGESTVDAIDDFNFSLIQSFHAVSTTAIEALGESGDAVEIESLIAKSLALFQAQAGSLSRVTFSETSSITACVHLSSRQIARQWFI
jgi:hypothetical protein